MGNLINKTGIPTKKPGDGLSHKDVNAINDTVNAVVDVVNKSLLQGVCCINDEILDYTRTFNLSTARDLVPVTRRSPGLILRFLNEMGTYTELVYSGKVVNPVSDAEWNNDKNWSISINSIDGGEW